MQSKALFFDRILPTTTRFCDLLFHRAPAQFIKDLLEGTFEMFILPGTLMFAVKQRMRADLSAAGRDQDRGIPGNNIDIASSISPGNRMEIPVTRDNSPGRLCAGRSSGRNTGNRIG